MATKVLKERYTHAAQCGLSLREKRKARKFTLKDVAERTGFSPQQIYLVEKGEINTPIETLARIAHALGVSLAQVLDPGNDGAYVMPEALQRLTRITGELSDTVRELTSIAS